MSQFFCWAFTLALLGFTVGCSSQPVEPLIDVAKPINKTKQVVQDAEKKALEHQQQDPQPSPEQLSPSPSP